MGGNGRPHISDAKKSELRYFFRSDPTTSLRTVAAQTGVWTCHGMEFFASRIENVSV